MMTMNNPAQLMQLVQQIKANPIQFLLQRKMNIPANIGTDPNAILQHLVQSGQVTQDQVNQAYQMAQGFRR